MFGTNTTTCTCVNTFIFLISTMVEVSVHANQRQSQRHEHRRCINKINIEFEPHIVRLECMQRMREICSSFFFHDSATKTWPTIRQMKKKKLRWEHATSATKRRKYKLRLNIQTQFDAVLLNFCSVGLFTVHRNVNRTTYTIAHTHTTHISDGRQ